jgi:hypothetical protein
VAGVLKTVLPPFSFIFLSSFHAANTVFEQMVFAEATPAVPLIAGYAWHKGAWRHRALRRLNRVLEESNIASHVLAQARESHV